jgi:hypothetical protein
MSIFDADANYLVGGAITPLGASTRGFLRQIGSVAGGPLDNSVAFD